MNKELVDKINIYFDNPEYLFEERKKIFKNEAGPNKGSSGKYIANKIISFL